MHHISILKENEDPSQAFPYSACKSVLDKHICPLCPVTRSKPKLLTSEDLVKHITEHFNESRKTLTWRGFKITTCSQPCEPDKIRQRGHYHCPFCSEICNSKEYLMRRHATSCEGLHIPKKELKNVRNEATTDPQGFKCSPEKGVTIQPLLSHGGSPSDIFTRKGTKDQVSDSHFENQHLSGVTLSKEFSRLNNSFLHISSDSGTQGSKSRKKSRERLLEEVNESPFTPKHTQSGSSSHFEIEVAAPESEDARSIILAYLRSGDPSKFESVFQNFSHNENQAEILMWINDMTECAALLDRKADKLVLAFLKIQLFLSQELAAAANSFIRTLVGHHSYYAYHALKSLFLHLIPDMKETDEEYLISAGSIKANEEAMYERVVSAIITINSDIPLTQDNLLGLASKCMPYFQQHAHKHAVYARNLLRLADSLPHLRVAVLEVIISNMITIDVHSPRSELIEEEYDEDMESSDEEDMFDMEIEDSGGKQADPTSRSPQNDSPLDTCQVPRAMTHRIGNTLDVLMSIMLQYVHDISHGVQKPTVPMHLQEVSETVGRHVRESDKCQPGSVNSTKSDTKKLGGCECKGTKHDIESLKILYNDLKLVFANIILRTHASAHVQFLLFYILSLRPGLLPFFADFLINKKFKDPNSSQCIRKNAMAYIGSLLAREKHVTLVDVHTCLEAIRDWCSEYLDNQEKMPERNYEDLTLHGPFYYACQTLFYVFTFRYKDYTENKRTLTMARSLNLERLVHSKLNPLLICSPPVVRNFALIANRFQIAYCHTVIENNRRRKIPTATTDTYDQVTTLDLFFPFDPYLLQRSKLYIQNHYREFDGLPEDIVFDDAVMDVEGESLKTIISPESYDSMYCVSPGFVRFSEESIYN